MTGDFPLRRAKTFQNIHSATPVNPGPRKPFLNTLALTCLASLAFLQSCKKEPPTAPEPTTGSAAFFLRQDCGGGNVTLSFNGQTRVLTSYFSSADPDCGASGTATFSTLEAGEYPYSASNAAGTTWSGVVKVTADGCAKTALLCGGGSGGGSGSGGSGGGTGGGSSTTGQLMMWIASDLGCGNITVSCNGQTRTISGFYGNGMPACGASGTATFSLSPGTYSYTGSCSGTTWSGDATVTAGGCSRVQFTSANGNGGGGGGGSSAGQVMFWTQTDGQCGAITVTCNGIQKIISGFYSSGAPSCGASACATYSLMPGTYSYTAECSGRSWSGTVYATANGCYKMQLLN